MTTTAHSVFQTWLEKVDDILLRIVGRSNEDYPLHYVDLWDDGFTPQQTACFAMFGQSAANDPLITPRQLGVPMSTVFPPLYFGV